MLLNFILLSATGGGEGGAGGFSQMIMFGLIILVMYFFMIRPQQKKAKEQQEFKNKIDKGQKIVTIGGIHGRIVEVKDKTFVIETGSGQKLEIEKGAVSLDWTKAAYSSTEATATSDKK